MLTGSDCTSAAGRPARVVRAQRPRRATDCELICFDLGPYHPLIFLRYGRQALIDELLDALAAIGFRRIDIALRIGRNTMDAVEFARLAAAFAETCEMFESGALDDMDAVVFAIGQVYVLLLRIFREC